MFSFSLQPQNLVLTGEFPDCDVKLCDFGISRYISHGADIREILGTPDYIGKHIIHTKPANGKNFISSLSLIQNFTRHTSLRAHVYICTHACIIFFLPFIRPLIGLCPKSPSFIRYIHKVSCIINEAYTRVLSLSLFSSGSTELRADKPGDGHVVGGRAPLRPANGLLAIRRRHQAGDLLQHKPLQARLPGRPLRGGLRGGARPHTPPYRQESKVYIRALCRIYF